MYLKEHFRNNLSILVLRTGLQSMIAFRSVSLNNLYCNGNILRKLCNKTLFYKQLVLRTGSEEANIEETELRCENDTYIFPQFATLNTIAQWIGPSSRLAGHVTFSSVDTKFPWLNTYVKKTELCKRCLIINWSFEPARNVKNVPTLQNIMRTKRNCTGFN